MGQRRIGVRHFLDGLAIVFGERRFWRFIAGPLALSAVIFLVLAGLGLFVVGNLWHGIAERLGGGAAEGIGPLLYIVALFFSAGFIFLTITSFTSSLMWEQLSAAVEESRGGFGGKSTLPRSVQIGDSIARGCLAIGVGLASLCCNVVLPFVVVGLLAGWLGLIDYTSPAFLRRNVTLGGQIGRVLRLPGAFTFLLISGAIALIPFVNVVLLPALVAGGTLMVMRSERRA